MNKISGIIATAALSLYAGNAKAVNDIDDTHTDTRLGRGVAGVEDGQPEFLTITATSSVYAGIDNVELNHDLIGYGVGEKIGIHIGLVSFLLGGEDIENPANILYLGLELSPSFTAIITGGVYGGFVAQQNADISAMVLTPGISGGAYAGTGFTFVNTYDQWGNEQPAVYGNVHAGGRLILEEYLALEFELGGVFNEKDSGFYARLGIGCSLPALF